MVKNIRKSDVVRIDSNLINQIKDIAQKNQMGFTEASKEIAKITEKLRNKRILREIKI